MTHKITFALCFFLLLFTTPTLADKQYAFVQMGKLKLSDNDSQIGWEGEQLTGEYDDLPFFSGGTQTFVDGDMFRYGYEAGAMISWQNDSVSYYGTAGGSGTEITVQIDNELILFGTFLGVLGDINFNEYVRIFASAGPMLLMASMDQQSNEDNIQTKSTVTVNGRQRDFTFGYGVYASAGLVISLDQYTEIGLVLREQDVNLNFSKEIADVSYDGRQILLSIGYKM